MAESIVKIKLQADTSGLKQLDSAFTTTGSKILNITRMQELQNKLQLDILVTENKRKNLRDQEKRQLEIINSFITNNQSKEILSNRVLQETKKNLDALSGSLANFITKEKEAGIAARQFATLDATKISAVRPAQPFSLGLSTTVEQLAQQTARQEQEQIKQEASTRAFIRRRLEAEREFTDRLKAEFGRREAVQKARTVDFGKTLTAGGIFKPASDYGNAMVAGMSRSYREIAVSQKEIVTTTGKIVESNRPWGNSLSEIIIRYRAINFVYNEFLNALYNIPKVGIQLESTTASLTATFGSAAAANRELKFLTEEAMRSGVAVGTLREQYASAAASFISAGESADTTRKIFQNINTVATTLHLSSDRVSSVYLALSQIFNKTKLQAEELTKQLSQTIPGVTNQQAKALGITVSELYDRMKNGAISAHEAVLALSETLGETYGGEAFRQATEGLNARVQQLNTSWTLLSENIYKAVEPSLKTVVQASKSVVDSLVDMTSNTNASRLAFEALVGVLTFATIASIGATAVKIVELSSAGALAASSMGKFMAAMAPLYGNPWVLGIAALSTLAITLYNVSVNGKEAEKQILAVIEAERARKGMAARDITAAKEVPGYDVFSNTVIKDLSDKIEAREKLLANLGSKGGSSLGRIVGGVKRKWGLLSEEEKSQQTLYLQDLADLQSARANAINDIYKTKTEEIKPTIFDASEARAKFEIASDKASGDKVLAARKQFILSNAKELSELQQQLDDATRAGNQEKINEAVKGFQDYQTALANVGIKDTSAKDAAKAATQAYKTDLQDVKNSFESFKTDMADTMGVLNELYAEGQLSIQDYYQRRIALMNSDKDIQRQMLEAEKEVAIARGDSIKVAQLEGEILKLNTDAKKENSKATVQQIKDLTAYQQKMDELRALDFQTKGEFGKAATEKFKVENILLYRNIQSEADAALLQKSERRVGLAAELSQLDKEQQLSQQRYNLELDKVNTKVNAGIMGQFQAMSELTKANEDYIKVKEAEYASLQESINKAGDAASPMEKLKAEQLNAELEKMKLSSNEFANYFSKTVGDGFADAFTEFAKGTKTAKEAFSDMAASIMQEIAKMAAQEAATSLMTSIFKPLMGAAFSGLGSYFGGGVSGNGPLLSYANPFANGGVASGLSSVSGSVLSSATYFPNARVTPLAAGGVVAGEAGSEAVLPLKRNKYGKLGVALENSGQSNGNVYNISVNVQSSQNDTPSGTGEKIAVSIMRSIAKEEIHSANRSGHFKAARSM